MFGLSVLVFLVQAKKLHCAKFNHHHIDILQYVDTLRE